MTTIIETSESYAARLKEWQQTMDTSIRAEDSWLAVVGLEWLSEGDNTVGSGAGTDVTLPNEAVPAQLGLIRLENGVATLHVTTDDTVLVDGVPAKTSVLNDDHSKQLTLVQSHSVTFFVIKRGDRYAVRIRDAESEARRNFTGRVWFPVNESYRVVGRFIPHEAGQKMEIETVIGTSELHNNPGRVEFELHGQTLSLEALEGGKDSVWFVFRDATSGVSTYGSSRFLKAPLAADGTVDLDFNQAYNPPCYFTPYATCPLPPRANRLTVAIEAGETIS